MEYYLVINLNKLKPKEDNMSSIGLAERSKYIFHSEVVALENAQLLAEKNPRELIGIFKAIKTLETKSPTFMQKVFNDRGELLPS